MYNPKQARVPAGSPGGGRFGGGAAGSSANNPRNAAAATAQKNVKAEPLFNNAVNLSPADRAKFLKGLSDADLELLTQVVYSARTSDPKIVAARLAVAAEMGKRGIDIKHYGALGGGISSPAKKAAPSAPARKVTPAQRAAVARVTARKATAKPAAKPAARPAAPASSGSTFRARAV